MSRDYSPSNSASIVFRIKIDIPRLHPSTAAKLKAELERLEGSGNSHVQKFVSAMRERYRAVLG
jgi:hypothetical protein